MSKFTKQRRQEIVRDFAVRHNGHYNPRLFLEEVKREGDKHPAYDWFQWDTEKAAFAHHLEQAREFAQDLRVVFTVEAVGGAKNLKVKEAPMPLVISPMENRSTGGGYLLVDPKDPAYIAEHCRQAAMALKSWYSRYQAALLHVEGGPQSISGLIEDLEKAGASGPELLPAA